MWTKQKKKTKKNRAQQCPTKQYPTKTKQTNPTDPTTPTPKTTTTKLFFFFNLFFFWWFFDYLNGSRCDGDGGAAVLVKFLK